MRRGCAALLCCWLLTVSGALAGDAASMRYIHPPPESPLDQRYDFEWRILEAALQRTRAEYGPYAITAAEFMTERRQVHELAADSGRLSILFLGTSPEMERLLLPVRIPVDLNLQGYCVLLIRDGDQPRFAAVRDRQDLRQYSIGLGLGWIDVDIVRSNGLQVVTGSSYDGLFDMLAHGRFDGLLRSAVEVLDEYAERRTSLPGLAIEDHLLIYYPMPMYFWFARTPEGRRLAERVERGMHAMLADGSYQRIFSQFQDWKITRLHLWDRRIIRLDNPLLDPRLHLRDQQHWFNPQRYHSAR